MFLKQKSFSILVTVFLIGLMISFDAPAGGVGGGMPWDTFLQKLQTSLTGPFAVAISLIGIVVAGAALIFGGEINTFFKAMIFLVLVISIITSAQNLLSQIGITGAVIASTEAGGALWSRV